MDANIINNWRSFIAETKSYAGWHLLTEVTLKRILEKYFDEGFIIITADRSCKAEKGLGEDEECDPKDVEAQAEINNKNYKKIRDEIRQAGFGFLPVRGGYKEKVVNKETGETKYVDTDRPEKSLIVMARPGETLNSEKLKDLGIKLAKKYNQDSFMYKPPSEEDSNIYYIDKHGDIDMTFNDVIVNDVMQIYYTQLHKRPHERFTASEKPSEEESPIQEVYIPKPPSSVAEARKRMGEIFIRFK